MSMQSTTACTPLCGPARLLACLAALLIAGCQTPPAVYELAEKSSINAGLFQNHLNQLAAQSTALAKERAQHIAAMDAFNARLDASLKRELYMQEQSQAQADWTKMNALMQRLTGLRDGLVKLEADAQFAQASRQKDLLSSQVELETYKAALRDTTAALSSLAKRESRTERTKFFAAFAKEVRADMKKSLESGDKDAVRANALIDSLERDFKRAESETEATKKP